MSDSHQRRQAVPDEMLGMDSIPIEEQVQAIVVQSGQIAGDVDVQYMETIRGRDIWSMNVTTPEGQPRYASFVVRYDADLSADFIAGVLVGMYAAKPTNKRAP